VPIVGDDIKSQVGATITHRVLSRLFEDRGTSIDHTYQLNFGGNMDFMNMLERKRLKSKKISKTQSVTSQIEQGISDENVHIGPSDHVPWLEDRKWAYIRLEGRNFGDVPLNIEVKQAEPPIVASVLAVLDRFGARERTLLAAEDGAIMTSIRAAAPDVVTSLSAPEVAEFVYRLRDGELAGYRPPGVALQVPPSFGDVQIITEASIAAAHGLGLEVHAWTINDEAEMDRLLDLGVDALMTDFPARAVSVLRRRGQRA